MIEGADDCTDSNNQECFPDNDAYVKVRYCIDPDMTLPNNAIQPKCPITDMEVISGSITTNPRQNWEERKFRNAEPVVRFTRAQEKDHGPIVDTRVASYLPCLDPEQVKFEYTNDRNSNYPS